jgi:hypothetical protein
VELPAVPENAVAAAADFVEARENAAVDAAVAVRISATETPSTSHTCAPRHGH